jgi:cob(I)alamin adenosyltransferase
MPNRAEEHRGLLQVYTGDGKGKTTAALGVAMRAYAAGKSVGIVYFDKGGGHYSERKLLDCLAAAPCPGSGSVRYAATGQDRIDPATGEFRLGVTEEDRTGARQGLAAAREMFAAGLDLVVLDEFNVSLRLGQIAEADGRALIDMKPEKTECICTGRGAPEWLLARADLVTEMKDVKHYFTRGIKARQGIDF